MAGGSGLPAEAEQLIEEQRGERRGADAAKRELADPQGEVAATEDQRDARGEEVARIGEIDLRLDPDPRHRRGDQPEDRDRETGEHRRRDRLQERAEFRRQAEQDRDQRRDHEDEGRIDLGHRHHADVLGIGGDAGAAARARDHRRQPVGDEAAADEAVHVLPGDCAERLDMAEVLGHQHDRHRGDQGHRRPVELGRHEFRQAEPGGLADLGEVDPRHEAKSVAQHQHQRIAEGERQEHRDPAGGARAIARDQRHAQHGEQGDGQVPGSRRAEGVELVHRDRCEVEPDRHADGAGDDRRHQLLDPTGAHGHHDEPDQRIDRAAGDDAAKRGGDRRAGLGGHREHHRDEGEGRAQIARHPAGGQDEEQKRADAGEEHRHIRVEAHQDRRDDGRAGHRQQVLDAHGERGGSRQPFVRHHHIARRGAPCREIGH
ncbi:hypothetical protein SDC9_28798 [bioreactor metagenome]|uniref:Uncharacterized protein n=1 Tax=bioreactor metagenome TaxID=1076179 RepID=A0A644UUW2_9ZZZZ